MASMESIDNDGLNHFVHRHKQSTLAGNCKAELGITQIPPKANMDSWPTPLNDLCAVFVVRRLSRRFQMSHHFCTQPALIVPGNTRRIRKSIAIRNAFKSGFIQRFSSTSSILFPNSRVPDTYSETAFWPFSAFVAPLKINNLRRINSAL